MSDNGNYNTGVVCKHTEYPITNVEWVLVNDVPLSVYLDRLGIEVGDSNAGNFQRMAILSTSVCGNRVYCVDVLS